jgi:NADH dehydrogenase
MAGALAELAGYTLRQDFRSFDPAEARVILVEMMDRIVPTYPPDLSEKARASLARLGVEVRVSTRVTGISADDVSVSGADGESVIPTRTVLWAAGVQASPLGRTLAEKADAELDRAGRVIVEPDLTVPGYPEIFVIGDLAHVAGADGKPLPGMAPVAMQQGDYTARAIRRRLEGKTPEPFQYRDKGRMAVIGRSAAVAEIGPLKMSGFLAWLAWLFIHLLYIVEFESRVLIAIQWGWRYFTGNRGARIITEPAGEPPVGPCVEAPTSPP